MEIYENEYSKEEDFALWELHEIRHALQKEMMGKSISKRNQDALKKFAQWEKEIVLIEGIIFP